MEKTKVLYSNGDNELFDYYIIDRKTNAKKIENDKNSLAYKLDGPGHYLVSKVCQIPFGNFDYILEIRIKKTSEFKSLTLASKEDISEL